MEVSAYQPYFDPEFESLLERIHPPRVCIDNDACPDATLVKVDSANRHGILLEMVQVLTDLDLVISKSYISSDGGWFMDVFHVTDHLGSKLTDKSLLLYIQQCLCATRRGGISKDIPKGLRKEVRSRCMSTENTALELTGSNRPGLLSEISATISGLGYHITAAVAWTHNSQAACIIYIENGLNGGPITDSKCLAHLNEHLEHLVESHHGKEERRSVGLALPAADRTQTERRLHQLMYANRDYEQCQNCGDGGKLTQSLIAAIERRTSQGLRLDVCTQNRIGLLSDITRVFRENGLSIARAEIGVQGDRATGSFYVTDTAGKDVNLNTVERVRQELGGTVSVVNKSSSRSSCFTSTTSLGRNSGSRVEESPRFSFGSLLWSQFERLSHNFSSIRP
ncbi:ACT domain-containing protein ACR1-like [Carica papaya]|uniref:ACT domain-containing protein ACR1-like n=1 Tax=Carica papaya TaxID=3649 RepID=UPI000B8CBD48|nr:ACT domain-containing protein ACR1-like [Carica papaya]